MQRRTFLHGLALSGISSALSCQDVPGWLSTPGWFVHGEATQPGARLQVHVGDGLPAPAELAIQIVHTRAAQTIQTTRHARQAVGAGQVVTLVTPYPYDVLVAGTFRVQVLLLDPHGVALDTYHAGTYHVRRFRFSA